ncbi:thiamine phosphate synthase [Thalassotalea agarivorans]|uniref:Thiamine-phosphate diphosphorylase n=1 Tax=Thalassotalea agarivorans TaxID=349064 RepID=A0A1I0CWM5_THASX|nr:thiamine phosphate synthase [Thalassotalea agarivorans]SET23714.1 thiamine-phosphate diphosphorylase [Thalassotalea agarivorans]
MSDKPIIWTISGSDCSAGAGIAADLRTGHSFGVEVCTISTANTTQNSKQFYAVNATDIAILEEQAQALLEDKFPRVIKIGLIANDKQAKWLYNLLKDLKARHDILVVYDPVGQASVGGVMSTANQAFSTGFYPYIDIITPNLSEAQNITGETDTTKQAKAFKQLGISTVIIKGGHSDDDSCTDICYHATDNIGDNGEHVYCLSSDKINTRYSHGGGCSFASAVAACLAQGYLVRDAITLAKAFINQGLHANLGKMEHYGAFEQTQFPTNPAMFPRVVDNIQQRFSQLPAFKPLNLSPNQSLGIYPVIGSIEWLEKLLPLNFNIIQLRLKDKSQATIEAEIKRAVELAKDYPNTRLFINDYWQLAITHGAYGVHIGQEDLLDTDLAAINRAGLRLGISTHGCYEFLLAQQLQPSYLAVGAIFPTKTKDMTGQIQGVQTLTHLLSLKADIPVVAIGGISIERAPSVWQTGVDSIAVVTAITEASDYVEASKVLQGITGVGE